MLARVSRIQGKPELVESAIPAFQESTDMVQGSPGFEGGYLLVNRDTGEIITVTLWEGCDAEEGSAGNAEAIVRRAARLAGAASPTMTEVFEVLLEV